MQRGRSLPAPAKAAVKAVAQGIRASPSDSVTYSQQLYKLQAG